MLSRKRKLILRFFWTVVIVVTVSSFLQTPIYRATVTILIDEESPNVLTTTGNVSLQSPDYLSYKEYYQSQIEMLTSYSLARKVFDDFKLNKSKEYAGAKEPVQAFLKTVKVEPVRDSRLVKLSVENRNPQFAAQIANRMADLFVKRNLYYISRNELMNLFKNEYLKLESKLEESSKVYKEKHPAMMEARAQMVDLAKKLARVKESSLDYTLMEQDIQTGGRFALAALKANNISIQDPAEAPVIPISPKKRLNILLAAIVGLLGGVGLALFQEYEDKTVKDVEDIEAITKWHFLGKVPAIEGTKREINSWFNGNDAATEAYRSIRTRLLFMETKEEPLKTIVISSIGVQEGKTLTSCNLAITFAHSSKQVLLVDADMRRPRLHDIFDMEDGNKGLDHYLGGQASYEELVHKTKIDNLSLVASKHSTGNSTELLHGEKIKDFINTARKKFDLVFFDTPPIGVLTDATILATLVDGIIVVVESGKTPQKALARNVKLMEKAKIRVIGVIINKVLTTGSESYYYPRNYMT